MIKKIGLRQMISGEFTSGLSSAADLTSNSPEVNEGQQEMHLSPELAADFELGLESEIGDSCGCGCGHSCSGSSLESVAGSCSGCHHQGSQKWI
ncbi:MAG: hypothetical protein DRH03_07700 [Deltaproteobacteria bacterium]|nr:MAG: hypothetical protein DRH03_07700 [Deltaproteobacteria bacterium]